jgi:hypothetical protein
MRIACAITPDWAATLRDRFAFCIDIYSFVMNLEFRHSLLHAPAYFMKENTMVGEKILARSLAPEDIKSGIYVMTLHRQYQVLMSKCSPIGDPELVVLPVAMRPYETELPKKVIEVCLPYVVLETEKGKTEMLDTRSHRVAKVTKRFAKAAHKPHIAKSEKKRKPCRCSRKKSSQKKRAKKK